MATKELILPPPVWLPGQSAYGQCAMDVVDAATYSRFARCAFLHTDTYSSIATAFRCPHDLVSLNGINVQAYSPSSGYIDFLANIQAEPEGDDPEGGGSDGNSAIPYITANQMEDFLIDLSSNDDSVDAGDFVKLALVRYTGDADDTLSDTLYFIGASFSYEA